MSSSFVVFDSCIWIDLLRTGAHEDKMLSLSGVPRNSSVVLSELLRGVRSRAEADFIGTLSKNHEILTPTKNNWLESGEILAEIRNHKNFSDKKIHELHFDVLIALTARSHGARLITSNRKDFEMIASYRDFRLEIW